MFPVFLAKMAGQVNRLFELKKWKKEKKKKKKKTPVFNCIIIIIIILVQKILDESLLTLVFALRFANKMN